MLDSLFNASRHPSAGANATPWRLMRQAMPYFLSPGGYASPPLSLFFIINSRCNMRCQMCDVGQGYEDSMFYKNLIGGDGGRGDFPIERFESLMAEVRGFAPFVSITSTEPLLYEPLPRAVRAVKANGMGINVTSNGLLLEKRAEELVEAGPDQITISLDGPGEVHDRIRGIPGAFERILAGIAKVLELRRSRGRDAPRISVNTVVSNLNAGRIAELMERLPLDDLHQVSLALMTFCPESLAQRHNARWGDTYPASKTCLEGACDPAAIDVAALHRELADVRARFGGKVHFFFKNTEAYLERYFKRPDEFMDIKPCVFPWFTAQVTASGDLIGVTRCYPVAFGNIFETSFLDAWNGESMRRFRKELRRRGRFTACTRCEGVLY